MGCTWMKACNVILAMRRNFRPISILNKAVQIEGVAPEKYHGMDRFEARKELLKDLEQGSCPGLRG